MAHTIFKRLKYRTVNTARSADRWTVRASEQESDFPGAWHWPPLFGRGSQAFGLVATGPVANHVFSDLTKRNRCQVAGNRTLRMDRLLLTSDLIDNEWALTST